jgi:hypothetical protein
MPHLLEQLGLKADVEAFLAEAANGENDTDRNLSVSKQRTLNKLKQQIQAAVQKIRGSLRQSISRFFSNLTNRPVYGAVVETGAQVVDLVYKGLVCTFLIQKNSESERHSGDIVELPIGHVVTWHEAQSQADREAGGLPTCDDLRRAGVNAGDVDLWMPVQRPDGMRGDYCQIGTWRGYMAPDAEKTNKTRYISYFDAVGKVRWSNTNDPRGGCRPGPDSKACKGIFYARKKGFVPVVDVVDVMDAQGSHNVRQTASLLPPIKQPMQGSSSIPRPKDRFREQVRLDEAVLVDDVLVPLFQALFKAQNEYGWNANSCAAGSISFVASVLEGRVDPKEERSENEKSLGAVAGDARAELAEFRAALEAALNPPAPESLAAVRKEAVKRLRDGGPATKEALEKILDLITCEPSAFAYAVNELRGLLFSLLSAEYDGLLASKFYAEMDIYRDRRAASHRPSDVLEYREPRYISDGMFALLDDLTRVADVFARSLILVVEDIPQVFSKALESQF